jgi:DNA-binding MarR family transcriptional regulator
VGEQVTHHYRKLGQDRFELAQGGLPVPNEAPLVQQAQRAIREVLQAAETGELGLSALTEQVQATGASESTVKRAVSGLVDLGFVEKRTDPANGRQKVLRLTDRPVTASAAAAD